MAGVEAVGIYGFPDSLPMLLDILKGDNPPPYLRDEVVLAMADILDVQNKFYSLLVRFLADESLAVTLALDEAESAFEYYMSVHGRKRNIKKADLNNLNKQAKAFQGAVSSYIRSFNGGELSQWLRELPDDLANEMVKMVLAEVVLDEDFNDLHRLRLLIVHWAAHGLRRWTTKLKE